MQRNPLRLGNRWQPGGAWFPRGNGGSPVRRAATRDPARVARAAPDGAAVRPDHAGPAAMRADSVTEARPVLAGVSRHGWRSWVRLVWLHAASRRMPMAVGAISVCAVGLRIALIVHWNASGALLLPLIIEAAAVCVVSVSTASPLGEPERVAGRWLPWL